MSWFPIIFFEKTRFLQFLLVANHGYALVFLPSFLMRFLRLRPSRLASSIFCLPNSVFCLFATTRWLQFCIFAGHDFMAGPQKTGSQKALFCIIFRECCTKQLCGEENVQCTRAIRCFFMKALNRCCFMCSCGCTFV